MGLEVVRLILADMGYDCCPKDLPDDAASGGPGADTTAGREPARRAGRAISGSGS